jgi:hypothetical protein
MTFRTAAIDGLPRNIRPLYAATGSPPRRWRRTRVGDLHVLAVPVILRRSAAASRLWGLGADQLGDSGDKLSDRPDGVGNKVGVLVLP